MLSLSKYLFKLWLLSHHWVVKEFAKEGKKNMAAYVVIRIKSDDPAQLKDYQNAAPSIIKKFNGKLLARGGEVVSLEGPEETRRIVIIEFPDVDTAKRFYYSDEYTKAIELRKDIADFELIAVEGLD